ncbi:NKAP family protein UM04995-like [Zingiber officinale]|uniref:Uncharacterized protein n=1 Tax=Zingiber officinale TaxID=94328 RepID=A0A8J5GTK0_ZINOF|nr:NKAP family protein UM04995-like [Zingiber officinale]KAG6509596.1 hypothetical protein ZIOFF_027596 [Zingiber officinale]
MDLETENRLASLLMEEARRMRVEAEKEGVQVYLRKPNVRGRPNSRFLTATVHGVQQANRAVEVSEMWRAREKELALEAKLNGRSKQYTHKGSSSEKHHSSSHRISSSSKHNENSKTLSYAPSKPDPDDCSDRDGLRDDEVEEFLRLRAKRGRGDVGSRMDEAGPYPPQAYSRQNNNTDDVRMKENWESRILGPEKPGFLRRHSSLDRDSDTDSRKHDTSGSWKSHSKSSKSKEEKSGKRKMKEKRSKHHKKSRR